MARINIPPFGQTTDEFGRPIPDPQYYGPPPRVPTPFDPIAITPDMPTPSETRLAAMRPPDVNDPQYKPSRGRTVLSSILGALAGASGGAGTGFKVAQQMKYAPYFEAQNRYASELGTVKEQVKAEQDQFERGYKPVELGTRRGVAESAASHRRKEEELQAQKNALLAGEYGSKDRFRTETIRTRDERLYQETIKDPFRALMNLNPEDPDYEADKKRIMDYNDAIAKAKGQDPAARLQLFKDKLQARGEFDISPLGKQANATKNAVSTTARISASTDPALVERKAAEDSARQAAKTKAMMETQLEIQNTDKAIQTADAKEARKISEGQRNTASSAAKMLDAFPRIREQLNQLGPELQTMFMPQFRSFLLEKTGTDPKFAPFRNDIKLLTSLLTQAHIGSRSAQDLSKKFDSLVDSGKMTAETLSATLDGIEVWANTYAKLKRPFAEQAPFPGNTPKSAPVAAPGATPPAKKSTSKYGATYTINK